MAKKNKPNDKKQVQTKRIPVPLKWNVPEHIEAQYATNLVVQYIENEYLLSFFVVKPPIIIGEPEVVAEKLGELESVEATCIAQIMVASEKMPGFLEALQSNLGRSAELYEIEE